MIHVHWWLFGLAFVVGLVLTFMLIVRPLKRRAAATVTQSQPEWPTTDATATEEFFTTATAEGGSRPAESEFATTVIPVGKESATSETSAGGESLPRIPGMMRPPRRKCPPTSGSLRRCCRSSTSRRRQDVPAQSSPHRPR